LRGLIGYRFLILEVGQSGERRVSSAERSWKSCGYNGLRACCTKRQSSIYTIMRSNCHTNFGELYGACFADQPDVAQRGETTSAGEKSLSSGGDRRHPAIGTLTRTRNLILAPLRFWELKQGIRS